MSYLTDFPSTKYYDVDLGWLIKKYCYLMDKAEDLTERVHRLEELYDFIPDAIKQATEEMKQQVNAAIAEMQTTVNAQLAEMRNLLDSEIRDVNQRVNALVADVNQRLDQWQVQIDDMLAKMQTLYVQISQYVDNRVAYMQAWVEAYVKGWSTKLPPMVCPADGHTEDLQTILWHMYNDLAFGIPVYELDALNITCQELDDMQIPVACLDRWGKVIFANYKCCYMQSPFTGEYVPISDVVLRLTRLHQNGVSVGELDAAELVVQDLDNKNVTAYDIDWTSVWFDELTATA